MFLIQAVVFFLLPRATSFGLFATLAVIVLLCYGGGFGTMPAFAADYFGPKNVGSVYGLMLMAWGVAGIVGPTLIARIRESTGAYRNAFYVISVIMLVSAIIPFIVRPPLSQQEAAAEETAPTPSPAPHGSAPPETGKSLAVGATPLGGDRANDGGRRAADRRATAPDWPQSRCARPRPNPEPSSTASSSVIRSLA
jgi:MFS family permease